MPTYRFHTRDRTGESRRGTMVAASAGACAEELRRSGGIIVEIGESAPSGAAFETTSRHSVGFSFPPATSFDVEIGLRQLSMMIRTGLSIISALEGAAENARRRSAANIWRAVAARIEAGSGFTEALERFPRNFPPIVREIVRAGEQSGSLDAALERCANQLESRRQLRAAVLQALLYPSIVLLLTTAVTGFMVLNVIPTLEKFLRGFHKKLPSMTLTLLEVSHIAERHTPTILGLLGGTLALMLILDRWRPTRKLFDRIVVRMPICGRIRMLTTTAIFSRTLSTLLANGIDIVRSLELTEELLGRPLTADTIAAARRRILEGGTLSEGFRGKRPFAGMMARMISIGEKTGELDRVLENVATFHEAELARWIKRASALIEPVVTVLVGGIVGFVYVAFIVAMFAVAGESR